MSTAAQKKALKDFKSVTGATDKIATDILSQNSWDIERATDFFYSKANKSASSSSSSSSFGSSSSKFDATKLNALFNSYADGPSSNELDGEKLAKFFADAGVAADGPMSLGVAWQLKSKSFGSFDRKEFIDGFSALGCDTLDKIKASVVSLQTRLNDPKTFKEFYRWVFEYIKEDAERKTVEPDSAYDMWTILLPSRFPLLNEWLSFCRTHKSIKAIPKDVWDLLLDFGLEVKSDLSNYDPDGAWPVLIDEFIDKRRAQLEKEKK